MKKNEHAQALGKLGGAARAALLSKERRKEIGRKAAQTRWKHHVKKGKS
jgi:hypothetical protein